MSGVNNWSAFSKCCPCFRTQKSWILVADWGFPTALASPVFDLARMNELLSETIAGHDVEIWLEPGRYLAAECGILLSRVTQLKTKGQYHYLGINTGMNALIRPALYGAYHDIVNLSRLSTRQQTETTVWLAPILRVRRRDRRKPAFASQHRRRHHVDRQHRRIRQSDVVPLQPQKPTRGGRSVGANLFAICAVPEGDAKKAI